MKRTQTMNKTILKFNYPESLIKDYKYWLVLLRPNQVTLGSLIIAYKGEKKNFSDINREEFYELEIIYKQIEYALKKLFNYDKINYLTLMMIDNHVHTHVIPRYESEKKVKNYSFQDKGWPGLPDLQNSNKIDIDINKYILDLIKDQIQ